MRAVTFVDVLCSACVLQRKEIGNLTSVDIGGPLCALALSAACFLSEEHSQRVAAAWHRQWLCRGGRGYAVAVAVAVAVRRWQWLSGGGSG